ncbi:papain family cysteine protease [Necator americanus]|uniref:Papain family cysteine protease n=1 Tax=Necator americanus TaxID=51031 RepID=W2T478_NECAM|nr:papain family cysteine protease [Necator americanus]ETN76713.1 papain family cysteine protease [Necator americanus]
MSEKERRNGSRQESRCSRNRCLLITAIVLSLIGIVILTIVAILYIRSMNNWGDDGNTDEYLRKLVRQINDNSSSTWKAKFNKFGVKNRSYGFTYTRNSTAVREVVGELQKFFDSDAMKRHIQELADYPDSSLPTNFDARLKWPHCPSISRVPNQGGCGSCYAVAAAGVASDRACIHSNGTFRASFSEEDVLGCCEVCGNCYGGDPLKALVYWVNQGLVTGKCSFFYDDPSLAYSLYPRGMTVSDSNAEKTERSKVPTIIGHFNSTAASPLSLEQIRTIIKKEISLYGPTTMAFPVPEEFLHYSTGVFRPVEGFQSRIVYWHVVRLIGWGESDDGSHYWLAINSFGEHWGDSGTFKINTDQMEHYGLEYETALV